jgi:ATP-binding protein involved in chromosome partitioning
MKTYHDIPGDGGSKVIEQVAEMRSKLERNLAGVRQVLAIGSGKGGVGKSTLTWQLACALEEKGETVAILDADLNGPSQARLSRLGETPPIPGRRGLSMPRARCGIGVVSLGSYLPETRALDFESVSAGDSFVWRGAKEFSFLGELLAAVEWGELDILLVDLPPGAERTRQYAEYFGPRTSFVLVTVPSSLSRGVVTRAIAALGKTEARVLGYVENMKGYYCAGCGTVQALFPESGEVALGPPLLGEIPFDPLLAEISDAGGVLPGERPTLQAIRRVAGKVQEALRSLPSPKEMSGERSLAMSPPEKT